MLAEIGFDPVDIIWLKAAFVAATADCKQFVITKHWCQLPSKKTGNPGEENSHALAAGLGAAGLDFANMVFAPFNKCDKPLIKTNFCLKTDFLNGLVW